MDVTDNLFTIRIRAEKKVEMLQRKVAEAEAAAVTVAAVASLSASAVALSGW